MLPSDNEKLHTFKRIRRKVEIGIIPQGYSLDQINKALRETKKPNILEGFGFLQAKHFRNGKVLKDYGLISVQKVTQAFTQYLVDSLQDSTTYPMDDFKWHASGTGTNAEQNTDTALQTEVESRVSGTQVEGASTNIYRTVATITYTATRTIAEHGVFSANAAGTLLDRSVLGVTIPVENADQIEWTYELTVNAEA